ncbi:YceI family protein [Arenimonas sp. GDDSR-1]|uniref:YceI family protein n=1 Tax=Arenimonas sp. GDDSR-1 TaxID=2950125 RepID=UPI00260E154B|nr:YceI family protein [Arenimonas sp. GDDSR-1]
MKKYALLALAAFAFAGTADAAKYAIDPGHTQVQFSYNHFGFSNITGRFDQISGEFDLDTADLAKSKISVEIPIASISTGVSKLDQHLQSADFFDAAKYPTASFKSKSVHVASAKELHVSGDLTIHGVTKPATLTVKVNGIGNHPMKKIPAAGFDASTVIKRSDFGVGAYVPAVSDEVRINITLEATEAK